jgi:hypothetical protein
MTSDFVLFQDRIDPVTYYNQVVLNRCYKLIPNNRADSGIPYYFIYLNHTTLRSPSVGSIQS